MPVKATIRKTIVARIATAVRPKFAGVLGATEALGAALESADTVEFHEVEV
jgi:hypothetical protein